ncbi:16S rRNA (guanine(966)-N(2))-methyltransferase RsmD [Acidiferrimicrobium sp. IK]|uniref:16S rRNA (guanine(966)-N(2))-methyltransferase RsmD n=1 Tax=Acidiferrimicrobium sp. IK TaxID=2871700 RepID=UPI0021CB8351|nr:16S rRNA (guanine(966)-N(2))-methyltransferase RsmD [Acidiferrimicrobium sp. IK]MCU4183787.1 16S rRNA (guanine(966)-N(2))-methyltransferase RsmD [Acidiferrimicrobium sp. IK]
MRVVAGSARGRAIQAPAGRSTRPTGDRVREAVFNALTSLGAVQDATVVDLFAGSGALGIEALSRGARAATFVERDRGAAATVRANLAALGFDGPGSSVLVVDAVTAAGSAPLVGGADVVFADPPYRFEGWPELLAALTAAGFGGILVAETGRSLNAAEGWDVVREKAYGSTVVTMLRPVCAPREGGPIQEGHDR